MASEAHLSIYDAVVGPILGTPFYHLAVECVLVLGLLYLIFFSKSYRMRSTKETFTPQEEEELIRDWQPEPLVPLPSADAVQVLPERIISGTPGPFAVVNGKRCLNLSSFNFLGFLGNREIEDAATKSVRKYGVGSCGPRGFYGTFDVHLDLESKLAEFTGTQEAILYAYAFSAIASAIPAYSKRDDIIFADEGVHFAIQKGLQASRSTVKYFRHNDMDHLESLLKKQKEEDMKNPKKAQATRQFMVVEGLYINYGDICPFPKLVELKYKYKVRLFVDETISFGSLGPNGCGVTEHFEGEKYGIKDVDLMSGSLEHAVASIGGFCCGTSYVVDHQRLSGTGYVFSASPPPLLVESAIVGLKLMAEKKGMFTDLRFQSRFLRKQLEGIEGMSVEGDPVSPIIHLRCVAVAEERQEDEVLQQIVDRAYNQNVLLTRAEYLQEERNMPKPSIRLAVCLSHSEDEMREAARVIKQAAKDVLG
ncbi:serine palmitoyltransferase 1-like [Oscarella lobularis]|uniref:serine palmitoyltransferase 1-like n=1 Tax=Oscarella lobularis TaxID=121494 RepID=UPI003313384C